MKDREWISLAIILGFLIYCVIAAKTSESHTKTIIVNNPPAKQLEVEIVGAVTYPGTYSCNPGTPLKELLTKAVVKPSANKRKIAYKKILFSSQVIEISEKKGNLSPGKKISLEKN